jgi:cyclopropane fatty-acyl-phospholipid synthase-like methyltransferase
LCNILHHFGAAEVTAFLRRVLQATSAGGVVAIWEIERPRRGSRATDGDGAALFFQLTSTGGAYHGDDYTRWLRECGFTKERVQRPLLSPGNVLVTACSPT